MGNTHSEAKVNEMSESSKYKIEEQNQLHQERIKNQILQNHIKLLQQEMSKSHSENLWKKSEIPLLSNPHLQQEFLKNKKFQKEFLETVIREQNKYNRENLNNEQYNQINNYLQNLNLNENNNQYLHLNQGYDNNTNNYNYGEEKKLNIGNSSEDQQKLFNLLKLQKEKQEEEMKKEKIRKQKEYENTINNINDLNIDPYKILQIPKHSNLTTAKNAFKRLARVYHPDKFNGNDTQFKIITKAFMILVDKFKKEQSDKQFFQLKEESHKNLQKQLNESKRSTQMKNMEGINFNNKLFNKVYQDNRLYSPNDEGYGNWIENNKYDSDKINKVLNSYDKNNFNHVFNQIKKNKPNNQIQKYSQPQALSSVNQNNCSVLGEGNIEDFSSSLDITKKKVQFTDYKIAHTDTTLIDIDSIHHKEYNNLEDLEIERSKKLFLSKEENEKLMMDEMLKKQQEEQRIERLNQQDNKHFEHFQKVNQIFLNRY